MLKQVEALEKLPSYAILSDDELRHQESQMDKKWKEFQTAYLKSLDGSAETDWEKLLHLHDKAESTYQQGSIFLRWFHFASRSFFFIL